MKKNLSGLIGFALCSLMVTVPSHAEENWCKVPLRDRQGGEISVDYRVQYTGAFLAAPLWINIKHPSLSGREEVKAFLIGKDRDRELEVFIFDLQPVPFESDRYTADLNHAKVWDAISRRPLPGKPAGFNISGPNHSGYRSGYQELVISIDGKHLIDPVSPTNSPNFKLDMYGVHEKVRCFAGSR